MFHEFVIYYFDIAGSQLRCLTVTVAGGVGVVGGFGGGCGAESTRVFPGAYQRVIDSEGSTGCQRQYLLKTT